MNNWKSARAILAGILAAIIVTTLVDWALHAAGVYPPLQEPINDALALLATSYRVVIGVGAAWLVARLAPQNPMKHAMTAGAIGMAVAIAGVITTWNANLGPRWYAIALAVLALPQSWVGAKLYESRAHAKMAIQQE
jgi:hypothetical protein